MTTHDITYTRRERISLWALAVVGILGVNGAFLYGALFVPGAYEAALSNPIALAFMVEAILLLVVLAYLLSKWGVNRLDWKWFVLLSMLGSIVFALPVTLLWSRAGASDSEDRAADVKER